MKGRWLLLLLGVLLMARADAPPAWQVDPAGSDIFFTATQAGAEFTGRFARFDADVRFDPADLEGSSARVVIHAASLDTRNGDRDEILRGPQFFHVETYPEAVYEATRFEATEGAFRALGRLTIRDVTRDVPLGFAIREVDGRRVLTGEAQLSRLGFGLGASDDWKDTTWVGDTVTVNVRVRAD